MSRAGGVGPRRTTSPRRVDPGGGAARLPSQPARGLARAGRALSAVMRPGAVARPVCSAARRPIVRRDVRKRGKKVVARGDAGPIAGPRVWEQLWRG